MKKYYLVETFITTLNDGNLLGKTTFNSKYKAESFAADFESLRADALAFVTLVEEEE